MTMNENNSTWDEEQTHPPLFGKFLEGWSSLFQKEEETSPQHKQKDVYTDDCSSTTNNRISDTYSTVEDSNERKIRRKSSIQIGNEVMSELLEKDNVKKAMDILQHALTHLT
ncbi:unnamed protein product [Mucor hiemalis]